MNGDAVVTNNPEIADKVRVLRKYGSQVQYNDQVQGFNSRLDELQAAFLRVKLKKLDEWNARRTMVAQSYLENLAEVPSLTLPHVPSWADPIWHLFVIRSEERDELAAKLKENGIQTLIHYPIPPHLSEAYQNKNWQDFGLNLTRNLAREVLSLPMGSHLTFHEIPRITGVLGGRK